MILTLLLTACGVLNVTISIIYLILWKTDGPIAFHSWNGTVVLLGELALAAGLCAIGAAIWGPHGGSRWLLGLHGVALGALGTIQYGFTGFRISLLSVALLVAVMAASIGILEWRHRWIPAAAVIGSSGFAVALLALGFRWIGLEQGSHLDLLWLGGYFGFSAVSMLALTRRLKPLAR